MHKDVSPAPGTTKSPQDEDPTKPSLKKRQAEWDLVDK